MTQKTFFFLSENDNRENKNLFDDFPYQNLCIQQRSYQRRFPVFDDHYGVRQCVDMLESEDSVVHDFIRPFLCHPKSYFVVAVYYITQSTRLKRTQS